MPINFAAVHTRNPWRKHSKHQSLYAAIDGKDGAKNLLQKNGRIAEMWHKHGDVLGVFVWEDNAEQAHIFRTSPDEAHRIQTTKVATERISELDRKKQCSPEEIAYFFKKETEKASTDSTSMGAGSGSERQKIIEAAPSLYPDEIPDEYEFDEGLTQQVLINRFERSPEARKACIAHYGSVCQACNLDFGERYGPLGVGFIHVHHRVPISRIGKQYRVDPIRDLIPVCPNCHAMIHRQEPPLDIDELKALTKDK